MTKRITLAVSGSISAYKSADLTNNLTKLGYDVHILMTKAATQFITPLTLQSLSKNTVHLDTMIEDDPKFINHIELAKKTDLFIIAPASANTIAGIAHGFTHSIIGSVALALSQTTPKLIAPAMNTQMYQNPITQSNLKTLINLGGYHEIKPRESLLACGDVGVGALAKIDDIITEIANYL